MEKTRLYLFRGVDPEEPIGCSAYICDFRNLQLKMSFLDELILLPESPTKDTMETIDTKTLRDTSSTLLFYAPC
jgi:WD repeat-containing protein 35